MLALSATCLAIAVASKTGTLRVERREGRFGEFFAISDDCGLIEVALSQKEADDRISQVRRRVEG